MISTEVLDKIDANQRLYVEELTEFLGIPSVSTDPAHAKDVRNAAAWAMAKLDRLGFQTGIHETKGHPVVFGQRFADPGRPTILIYGHYDVQPPDPLDEWATPPFTPSIRDKFIYGRGATDNKGQCLTYLHAMEAILAVNGDLPVNVKVLIEGEEEIGSPNLGPYLRDHLQELATDAVAISDGSQFAAGMPAITYGLRGLSYLQVDVQGPRFDLHSGSFGGLVANPIHVLSEILAQLRNEDGTVAIPGFYDEVRDLEPHERQEMADLPLDEAELRNYLGVDELVGEANYIPMERKTARPTLDVNGIWGGFSGEGAKTIIPARAGAKISLRLVPDQRGNTINRLVKDYLYSLAPTGVHIQVTEIHGSNPVLVERDRPAMRAAVEAIDLGFGKAPVFIREGGSIPIVGLFKEVLGCQDILLLGWGSPDDGAHSPNERFSLDDFRRGTRAAAALLFGLAESLGV